jgi:uncharacterized C2H2 Zn-finger protein
MSWLSKAIHVEEKRDESSCSCPQLPNVLELMIQFDLPRLALLLYRLHTVETRYQERVATGAGNQRIREQELRMLVRLLGDVQCYGIDIDFPDLVGKAVVFRERLNHPEGYDSSSMTIEVRNLSGAIMEEIHRCQFLQVRKDLTKYINQAHPFGEHVSKQFPSAVADMVDAGNCLAVEANVFISCV